MFVLFLKNVVIMQSPKTVKTVRSEAVEVDVYIEDNRASRQIIICECKYWDTNVPQAVVHAFRTQVNDIGANTGLLITKNGFQPGARTSAGFTNIKLLTWNEFESLYFSTWYKTFFLAQIDQICKDYIAYTEPFNVRIFKKADVLCEEKQLCFIKLRKKHLNMSDFCIQLSASYYTGFLDSLFEETSIWKDRLQLPLKDNQKLLELDDIPTAIKEACSYKEFLKEIEAYVDIAVSEFDEIFGERA